MKNCISQSQKHVKVKVSMTEDYRELWISNKELLFLKNKIKI